jgi:electron transfer flavoprotein alpha subunit
MTLILIEHDRGQLKRSSLHAITLAHQLGNDFTLLAIGHNLTPLGDSLANFGAKTVLLADDPALEHPLADRYAKIITDTLKTRGAKNLLAASSTFTKDILPRVAAILDMPMLTDVLAIDTINGEILFRRPVLAGNLIATVRLDAPLKILTVRSTAFAAPAPTTESSPIERLPIDTKSLPTGTEFISREIKDTGHRPDLTEARVVVAGGRPLKDKQTFDRLIGGLADALHGAVAATRPCVDTGIAPNDAQVGQTGKIVAPELYIGVGVSGTIQHMAGVKDSRVIVAINKDPDAPIFKAATYGLVGDLHQIVPQLIDAIKKMQ